MRALQNGLDFHVEAVLVFGFAVAWRSGSRRSPMELAHRVPPVAWRGEAVVRFLNASSCRRLVVAKCRDVATVHGGADVAARRCLAGRVTDSRSRANRAMAKQ